MMDMLNKMVIYGSNKGKAKIIILLISHVVRERQLVSSHVAELRVIITIQILNIIC